MRHDKGDSSGLSLIIPDVECSGMKERASGAVRWRLCNGAEWKRRELAESGFSGGGSLRLCQRRQPEQQRSQSDTRSLGSFVSRKQSGGGQKLTREHRRASASLTDFRGVALLRGIEKLAVSRGREMKRTGIAARPGGLFGFFRGNP